MNGFVAKAPRSADIASAVVFAGVVATLFAAGVAVLVQSALRAVGG